MKIDETIDAQIKGGLPVCPYCEKEQNDCPEREYGTIACLKCGKKFYYESDVVYDCYAIKE